MNDISFTPSPIRSEGDQRDASLIWWHANEARFPVLSVLARRFLCIQVTSAASERGFSILSHVVTALRSCFSDQHVCDAVFLRYALPLLRAHGIDIVEAYLRSEQP